jgi:lysozyme
MTTGEKGIAIIKEFEGFYPKPYLCPAGVPTIGYGTIRYPNGKAVKLSDANITKAQAEEYLNDHIKRDCEPAVNRLVKSKINQNQFDALISFTYNLGSDNLQISALLRKVNANPNDSAIRDEFYKVGNKKWVTSNGKITNGLIRRRIAERELYFKN